MVRESLRIEHAGFVSSEGVRIDDLSMSVRRGEIMGLVPIDWFGIDALFELMQYNTPLHYGYVYMNERLVNSWDKGNKKMNRVSIIRGRSALAGKLTVADNVFVLRRGFRKRVIHPRQLEQQLKLFMDEAGINIPAGKYADELSEYERISVEILKAVIAGSWLIVINEPDSLVSASDLKRIHDMLRHYSQKGFTVLYVSSHYENLVRLCDRIAFMENGQVIKCFSAGERLPGMSELMRNASLKDELSDRGQGSEHDETGAADRCRGSEREAAVFDNVSYMNFYKMNMKLMHGQCILMNNLEKEDIRVFEDLISGTARPDSGDIFIDGLRVTRPVGREVAIIPPSPERSLLFPDLSYMDNLCMTVDERVKNVWIGSGIRSSVRKEFEQDMDENLFDMPVTQLSVEDKRELVYRRIMLQHPAAAVIIQPFRASGVALRKHTAVLIQKLLSRGTAVIIISAGMTDVIMITDDIIRYDLRVNIAND